MATISASGRALVNICGGLGIGKTRVLRAIAERLEAMGREVIRVSARRRLLGDRPDDERLIAALGGGHDLAEAVSRAVVRGSVLILDDIEFLSPFSRTLLLGAIGLSRVVASEAAMIEVPEPNSDRILVELPPLSYAEAGVLVRSMLQPARLIPEALIERLAVRGTGNPGMLIGLARDMQRRGAIRRQPGGRDWYVAVDALDTLLAPPGPSWFASRLIEDLPVELAAVVRLSAALGPEFGADEVGAAAAVADAEVRLGILVRDGVFVENNGRYAFSEASVQDAIYEFVLDERSLVHARLVQHWLARPDRNVIGRLARLAYHATGAGDHAIAGACWAALARYAHHAGAHDQVEPLLTRAVVALASSAPPQLRETLLGVRGETAPDG